MSDNKRPIITISGRDRATLSRAFPGMEDVLQRSPDGQLIFKVSAPESPLRSAEEDAEELRLCEEMLEELDS